MLTKKLLKIILCGALLGIVSSQGTTSSQGETGKRGYVVNEANESGDIGHSNKERHQKELNEEGGTNKAFNHDDGYYGTKQKELHKKNGYHYEDSGSYAKGHDTKGHHNVRKIDEFKKKRDFFDVDRDEGFKEKKGEISVGEQFKNGEFTKKGIAKKVFVQGVARKKGEKDVGSFNVEEGGFRKAAGRDKEFEKAEEWAKSGFLEFLKSFNWKDV